MNGVVRMAFSHANEFFVTGTKDMRIWNKGVWEYSAIKDLEKNKTGVPNAVLEAFWSKAVKNNSR